MSIVSCVFVLDDVETIELQLDVGVNVMVPCAIAAVVFFLDFLGVQCLHLLETTVLDSLKSCVKADSSSPSMSFVP